MYLVGIEDEDLSHLHLLLLPVAEEPGVCNGRHVLSLGVHELSIHCGLSKLFISGCQTDADAET